MKINKHAHLDIGSFKDARGRCYSRRSWRAQDHCPRGRGCPVSEEKRKRCHAKKIGIPCTEVLKEYAFVPSPSIIIFFIFQHHILSCCNGCKICSQRQLHTVVKPEISFDS